MTKQHKTNNNKNFWWISNS